MDQIFVIMQQKRKEMKIAFKALIRSVNNKSLISGDKETWITLRLQGDNVSDEILNALNFLQTPTEEKMIVIMDEME